MTTETRKELRLEDWPVSNPVHALLVEARAYIADGSRWCQDRLADEEGRVCALGAVQVCFSTEGRFHGAHDMALSLLQRASLVLYRVNVTARTHPMAQVNDDLGHAAVLRCYDWAIAEALKET